MDDDPSDAKRRRVRAPDPREGVTACTLDDIHAVLEEHARRIETFAAANKMLKGRNTALEERCKALDRKSESLERACDELEVRCSSLERSIQVLKKDVDWTYSAPDIPRSHWIEQGRDEEYADNVDECLERIKIDAMRIRNGEDFCCACLDNEDQLAILHDDAMLPHFKELANAIQLSDGIRQICIDNVELRPSVLRILFPAMEGKVTDIFMQCVRFPGPDVVECYDIIVTSVRHNHALKALTWAGNPISSDYLADLLIESIIDNRSIEILRLENCFDQNCVNGCRALTSLLTCGRHFQNLHFRWNGLPDIDDVTAALAANPQIETLDLTGNQLRDRHADLIAEALKQNTNLQALYMRGNKITPTGFEKILEAIYDPSSLTAMESCNHTCYVDFVEEIVPCNKDFMTPQQRRRRKLYNLLSTWHAEGSNARHLNAELGEGAFTTKLVPRVLESIGQCSVDRSTDTPTPLSLYFELMKSWKMPELYEHGRRDAVSPETAY
ncbi:hypothetical protein THAOC_16547 [Thalassiosira oceanica]|uniref:Uncharacterized protein n=1 Tax=Thalassiosira oceanica TaxID=159749 RepID=K0SPB3_THAOC|nr:hypothetical protein THAOC_16547 [Thalassiosira oceanica]|eukprot:EJK62826.1 hypothetical protein THAOC_16547 [Thalassiosira oceanica]